MYYRIFRTSVFIMTIFIKTNWTFQEKRKNLRKVRKKNISNKISNFYESTFLRKSFLFLRSVISTKTAVTFVCVAKSRAEFHKFQREEFLRLYKMRNLRHNLPSFFMLETFREAKEPYVRISHMPMHIHILRLAQALSS